ncbi:MAG: hypothetical protein K2Y32_10525 [Candidatus Obscuribacterales bacterium]|nr:hypothetical protein [Candidatus Obscuribacterales bacterium]
MAKFSAAISLLWAANFSKKIVKNTIESNKKLQKKNSEEEQCQEWPRVANNAPGSILGYLRVRFLGDA